MRNRDVGNRYPAIATTTRTRYVYFSSFSQNRSAMTVSQVQSFMFLLWVLFLGFRVVEAAALSSQRVDTLDNTTYAESLGDTTSNVSLETAAESLWDSPSGDSPSNLLTLATTGSLLSANQSVISQKLSAGVWKCEGNTFGYNLNGDSCYNALSASLLEWKDTNIKTWGPRNTGVQYDFTIPRRYVSRRCCLIFNLFRLYVDIVCRRWYLYYWTARRTALYLCSWKSAGCSHSSRGINQPMR